MSTQYRLVQSGKTASGGCSAGQGSSEPVATDLLEVDYNDLKFDFTSVVKENVGQKPVCWTPG
jgi:hypothetical protein